MSILVEDPFGVANDSKMPFLQFVLEPEKVQQEFNQRSQRLKGGEAFSSLSAIRVIRYKQNRRCLFEFDFNVVQEGMPTEITTLIGKVRSRSFGNAGYRLLDAIWNVGFQSDSSDGISVPEPIGTIPAFRMWLQRKISGRVATDLLQSPGCEDLVRRISEADHKLHQSGVTTEKTHSMVNELQILHEQLPKVSENKPEWKERINLILNASDHLGSKTPETEATSIHRDFYADQVIVEDSRISLIDFDLFCKGDPGLDIGNFIGHIIEFSLRTLGNPKALTNLEKAMEERFVELSGEKVRPAIKAYTTLTLVRHIYLSTLFPERRSFTETLIDICEERLDVKR